MSDGVSVNDRGPADRKSAGAANSLRLRIASAAVLLPVALGAVIIGGWAFTGVVAIVGLVMVFEWHRLSQGAGAPVIVAVHGIGLVIAILLVSPAAGSFDVGLYPFSSACIAVVATALALGVLAPVVGGRTAWAAAGALYLGLPVISAIWLRADPAYGLWATIWWLASVWAMDTGAYFSGRAIGGPKLAPVISPKKTWAGLIGGMACAGAVGGTAVGLHSGLSTTFGGYGIGAILSALMGGWSQMGDLVESSVKRHFDVKDFSRIIPGHGGVLDRVDSLLFAAPAAMLIMLILGNGEL